MNAFPELADTTKHFVDGAHRARDPALTVARVAPLLKRFGITRVANLTGLDRVGIPVVAVYRPNARSVSVSQGKGASLAAAKASGLMEAIEVWHAEHADLTLRRASVGWMRARHAVADVARLPRAARLPGVPDAQRLLWTEGVNLIDRTPVWCPLDTVHADFTLPLQNDARCLLSTNGLASGNHWLEAVCHAICELVERDAVSLWRARGDGAHAPSGRLDPATVDDPLCRDMLERYTAAGIDVGIWEVSGDTGVPVFFVLIMDAADAGTVSCARPASGKGCHPSKAIALLRALSEAAQTRLTYISGARDDLADADFDDAVQRENVQRCRALLHAEDGARPHDFGATPEHLGDDFAADLDYLLAALRAIGIEQVIAVDLAGSAAGFSVVRVVIPGLEGPDEHPAYVPGPRALGR